MRRLIPAALALGMLCLGTWPAAALFDQPPPFFARMTALTPPPLIPLSIDGTPQWNGGTTSTTPSVTVTTTQPNEILEMVASCLDGSVTSITDTAGLLWVKRVAAFAGTVGEVEEWYAYAPAPVSSDVITATLTTSIYNTIGVAAIVGTAIGITYDLNAALPVLSLVNTSTSGTTASTFISTSHGNDMLIEAYTSGVTSPLPPSGFTDLGSVGNLGFSYKVVASPQTNVGVTTGSGYLGVIATDALRGQ